MEPLRQWLSARLGLAPGIQDALVLPLLAILLLWIVRELLLLIAWRFVREKQRRRLWRQVSFYVTVLAGLAVFGGIWLTGLRRIAGLIASSAGGQPQQLESTLVGALYAFLTTAAFVLLLRFLQLSFRAARRRLGEWSHSAAGVRYQRTVLLTPDRIRDIAVTGMRIVRAVLVLLLCYFYVPLVLSFFPKTAPIGTKLLAYVATAAGNIGQAFLDYLPNLVYLLLIILVVSYLMKLVRFLLGEVGKGNIVISGFETEWADPTYKLARVVAILFTVVIIYPYLPGAGSEVFKGFSIFIGALVTIGSTAAIGNIISGTVLTYTKAFHIGDRVRIDNTLGDVIEKSLFVTRLRTPKNEEVTIPNAVVLAGRITNYSAVAASHGLILHTEVGIGYDVDWRKVHELLLSAATKTESVLAEPAPFVLQNRLDNYSVTYELNAYTDAPRKMSMVYSDLRKNILDIFHEAGVEIMTPSVSALRDANQPAIPSEHNPKPFQFPGFRFLFPGQGGSSSGAR